LVINILKINIVKTYRSFTAFDWLKAAADLH
jgi:hypothetical protein